MLPTYHNLKSVDYFVLSLSYIYMSIKQLNMSPQMVPFKNHKKALSKNPISLKYANNGLTLPSQ